jgi:hypothetical protein
VGVVEEAVEDGVGHRLIGQVPVTAPPSDAGAIQASAGVYILNAINGKPLPYTVPANKCLVLDGQSELKADGAYASTATVECAGVKYPFPTSGLFGIVGGKVTYAVGVGPTPAAGVTKLDGATLTTVVGADTYTSTKR